LRFFLSMHGIAVPEMTRNNSTRFERGHTS
jgi:hypothetical protein